MPRSSSPDADAVLRIQKYPNRRLYDRTTSRHLTHDELHELVVAGRTIEVVDSRSSEDITNLVLAQVLLEHAPARLRVFPPELLHVLIRSNQRLLPGLQQALLPSFASAIRGWQAWQRQMADMMVGAAPSDPFAWMLSALPGTPLLDDGFSRGGDPGNAGGFGQTRPSGETPARDGGGDAALPTPNDSPLEERLEAAIESLEQQLASLRSRSGATTRSTSTQGRGRGQPGADEGEAKSGRSSRSSASREASRGAGKRSASETAGGRAQTSKTSKSRGKGAAPTARKRGKTR